MTPTTLGRPRRGRLLQHDLARRCASSCAPTNVSSAPPSRRADRRQRRAHRSRPRRATCAPGRRRASPTRRANRRPRPASNHQSGTVRVGIGDERHVLHERSEARLADQRRRRSPGPRAPDRAPTGTRGRRAAVTPAPLGRREHALPPRAASSANGFSHTTCRPAAHASIASAACVSGGVAIVTASTPASASASASDVHACGIAEPLGAALRARRRRARRARRTSKPALRSAGTCTRHPKPVPTTTAPGTRQ